MAAQPANITDISSHASWQSTYQPKLSVSDSATVIESPTSKKPAVAVTTPAGLPLTQVTKASVASSPRRLTQSELYPVRHAFAPQHIAALRLLTVAIGRCEHALAHLKDGQKMKADTEIQKLQVLLPELFCCRSLGDGFGTLVAALSSGLEALNGDTPNQHQIQAFKRVLTLLWEKPFLTADEADSHLPLLESVGLSVYPADLLDFLASD